MSVNSYPVRILGSGIVSRCMALLLAGQGLRVALQSRPTPPAGDDVRTYALNAASVSLLERLKVWPALPPDARTAVHEMAIAGDDTSGHLAFTAWQQHTRELAWIVDAAALESALEAAVGFAPHVQLMPDPLAGSPISAQTLTIVAQGKHAALREQLGVRWVSHAYGHHALAARLVGERPHQGVARQWFRAPDVLALLPFDRPEQGRSWGLVWSQPAEAALHWREAPVAEFEAALAAVAGPATGPLRLASARSTWPLAVGHAERSHGPGWVLVGDAAHQMHPLAGQGLNVGLGDVQGLADTLAAREAWRPLGDAALLARHARARRLPVAAMTHVTDGLWQLFAHPHPLVREARNRGLALVDRAGPLKRWLARQALRA